MHGLIRKSSSFNTKRIDHLYIDPHNKTNFFLHYGDLTDTNSVYNIIHKIRPNEICNLGARVMLVFLLKIQNILLKYKELVP